MDGTHAWGEEERRYDRAIEVVQDVEGGEQLVLSRQAGTEDAGAGVGGRVEFGWQGVDDEEQVHGSNELGNAPCVATGEVEA